MSSSLPQPAPPTGNRFAVVTTNDHSASIIIVTILSCIFAVLVFAVRLLIVKRKRWGLDDLALGIGHVISVGHWATIFIALKYGLGKSLQDAGISEQRSMVRALFAGRILLVASLCFSKLSILLILRSLFSWDRRRKMLLLDATLALVIIWGIGGVFALSIGCSPDYLPEQKSQKCTAHISRLRIIVILDIMTECMIFGLVPLFLIALNITNAIKLLVITAFASRLPLIAFSTMYLISSTSYIKSLSTGTAIVPTIVWQEILLAYSLMSSTIPCLKSFVEGFRTRGFRDATATKASGEPYASDISYEMDRMRSMLDAEQEQIEFEDHGVHLRSSGRFSGVGGLNEGDSVRSKTSEQPIVGMAM